MTINLPPTVAEYVRATNDHDGAGLVACFAEDAIVWDAGREHRGLAAIRHWIDREIVAVKATLELLKATDQGADVVITTKVDGTFDRTGLPDPVIIDHQITVEHGKIARMTCRLATEPDKVPSA